MAEPKQPKRDLLPDEPTEGTPVSPGRPPPKTTSTPPSPVVPPKKKPTLSDPE